MGQFDGKVALITGAARGQGRSHAVRFAEEGADLVLLDICRAVHASVAYEPATTEDLEETATLVRRRGRRVLARQADVRDYAQVKAVVADAIAEFARLDIVVANAGICCFGRGWEISESAWDAVIDTNLKGAWNTLRAVVPFMIDAKRGGSIIITSAATEIQDQPYIAHYAASKLGMIGLMRVFAKELEQHGIRVNTVNPAGVNTPMASGPQTARLLETEPLLLPGAAELDHIPFVEPEDVTKVVIYLASDEANSITGVQMPIEGA
jgi:(+)-trans-carveol dehydrogenase